jgi:hypothetical protein
MVVARKKGVDDPCKTDQIPVHTTLNKLFVYGIFLSKHNRDAYGMDREKYATVPDYATFGGTIVKAVFIPEMGLSLTGLLVDVEPSNWRNLDLLESGYDRVIITTNAGERAYMYAQPERKEDD